MKSNIDIANMSDEDKLNASTFMVSINLDKTGKMIDSLSSASLKRVLRAIGHVSIAEVQLGNDPSFDLETEAEKKTIDTIFELQETVFGHQALLEELNKKESNINETDMSVSMEAKNE